MKLTIDQTPTAVFVLCVVCASCGPDNNVVQLHPTPQNIPEISNPQFILHEPQIDTEPWANFSAMQAKVIGAADGEHLELIGSVWDLVVGPEALYYVDFAYGHVRMYDLTGRLNQVIGKKGEGPGEFPQARHVQVVNHDEGELLIVGASGIQISVFESLDSSWVLKHSFHTAHDFLDGNFCAMHGHVYTIGYSEGSNGIIHKYTVEGEHVLSFGLPYQDPSAFVRSIMADQGSLACNSLHRTIAYAHTLKPFVTGFTPMGAVRWRVKLADANIPPVTQERTPEGRESVEFSSRVAGETSSIQFVDMRHSRDFVVSYYTSKTDSLDIQHLYAVDAESGVGAYMGWLPMSQGDHKLPAVRALDALRVYTHTSDPYPHIGIYPRPDMHR